MNKMKVLIENWRKFTSETQLKNKKLNKEGETKMTRWGRPIKNKRKRDPRYFLRENLSKLNEGNWFARDIARDREGGGYGRGTIAFLLQDKVRSDITNMAKRDWMSTVMSEVDRQYGGQEEQWLKSASRKIARLIKPLANSVGGMGDDEFVNLVYTALMAGSVDDGGMPIPRSRMPEGENNYKDYEDIEQDYNLEGWVYYQLGQLINDYLNDAKKDLNKFTDQYY